jgi:hypothetical protein
LLLERLRLLRDLRLRQWLRLLLLLPLAVSLLSNISGLALLLPTADSGLNISDMAQ